MFPGVTLIYNNCSYNNTQGNDDTVNFVPCYLGQPSGTMHLPEIYEAVI